MGFIKAVIFLTLLHIAYSQANDDDENTGAGGTTSSGCEQTAPATTYWTEWYSSSKTFTLEDRQEDFRYLCSSEVLDTECREKYTHHSLESLTTAASCSDGVISCRLSIPDYNCRSLDLEIRLLCNYTNDKLPEPDLHWSLSELDSGGIRGAVESWYCNDEVITIDPINGTIVGEVVQGESLSQTYGPQSHENLCGVRPKGNASLAFRPFVQNCLTSPDCCKSDHGISVMFWLRKNEMNGNHSRPQYSPLHVFRSPSLNATVQSGNFFVTYLHVNKEWTVNTTLADREWTHVTITFDLLTNLTVYLNGEAEGVAKPSAPSLSIREVIDEFKQDNSSFQAFSTDPGVTSPDIRPIAITDLKIFFSALSANLIDRMFTSEREDAPSKVMRMAVSQKKFLSSTSSEPLHHIKLTCLIRSHDDIDKDNIHFLYKTNGGGFEEMPSADFKMIKYLQRNNEYRQTAVAQMFGRGDGSNLPSFFTCDVTTASQLSVYGYEIIESEGSTDRKTGNIYCSQDRKGHVLSLKVYTNGRQHSMVDDTTYYWTRFYDVDPGNGGDEAETLTKHLELAEKKKYELPCQNPTYAECKTKSDSQNNEAKQWYEVLPAFVPDFDYWCEGEGIRCTQDHEGTQECPDLEVRYACPFPNATMSNGTEDHVSTTSMPNNDTRTHNESERTDTGSHATIGDRDTHVRVTEAPDTTSTSTSAPVHGWTPSSGSDTDSTTTRNNPSGHDVTNGLGVNDRTASPVSTSTQSSPDTSTSTGTALTGDSSTPDVSATSRRTDARLTEAPVGAEDTSESTVVNRRRTNYGGSTVSGTVLTSAHTTGTSKPTTARPSDGDSSKATGNKQNTITGNGHLNFLYPVMIVVLGIGIPTLTACYYLCRKLTPEEIEERRLIAERKRKLDEEQE